MRVRLVSYNIQFGRGQDGQYDLDRIAEALFDADIACLQEVTTYWTACNEDHQPERLAQALGMYSVYASGFELGARTVDIAGKPDNRRRSFGNMVLSRWPIVYSRSHSLGRPLTQVPAEFPDPKLDLPRCALEAVVEVPGFPLRVFSLHLSHLPGGQRQNQLETLRSLLQSLPEEAPLWERSDPMIEPWTQGTEAPPVTHRTALAGDFNLHPGDADYDALLNPELAPCLVDGWLQAGHDRHAPTCMENDGSGSTLDYVFVTGDLAPTIANATVRNTVTASDHFPLVFELETG